MLRSSKSGPAETIPAGSPEPPLFKVCLSANNLVAIFSCQPLLLGTSVPNNNASYRGQYNYNSLWRGEYKICNTADPFDLRCESVTYTYNTYYLNQLVNIRSYCVK